MWTSKNQKVLFLSNKIRPKKRGTDTKASVNYQNACKPLNLKVFIQYRGKQISHIKNRKKKTEKRKEKLI
jgi:hypothetical protein